MAGKYNRVFAIIKQINEAGGAVTYQELVRDFTDGRTTSLSSLSVGEFQQFERGLVALAPNKKDAADYASDPNNALRRAIIAHFRSIGRTADDAIDWAEKYGVNGVKRAFNDYTGQELYKLFLNAQKVRRDFIVKANKSFRGLQ